MSSNEILLNAVFNPHFTFSKPLCTRIYLHQWKKWLVMVSQHCWHSNRRSFECSLSTWIQESSDAFNICLKISLVRNLDKAANFLLWNCRGGRWTEGRRGDLQLIKIKIWKDCMNLFLCFGSHFSFFCVELKKMVDKIAGSVSFLTRSCSTLTAVHFTASQIQCF